MDMDMDVDVDVDGISALRTIYFPFINNLPGRGPVGFDLWIPFLEARFFFFSPLDSSRYPT